ncbi:methyl-accepting chemotaxis protein [Ureibacillus sinduriensis]|uniref:Chemotaxis protein n=1 Tax=Ureibacillus sinduriensis BLB-1 = JCM 15800 TaxID=1384057 RepID=A0A0A3HV41_9BACL|nr:methyl-accepting chemotaxis protein [Ureibacillus sinduriensis]KGR76274.1 chemotaxis protein [Ureibacillus sinduriensis BLB-1 = JCM 15800]
MKFLRNLSISKKLLIIIIVSALALGSVGTLGVSYINEMAKGSNDMFKDNLIPLNKIMQIRVNARASDAYTLELLVTEDAGRNKELIDEISSAWEEIDLLISEIETMQLTKNQQDFVQQYKQRAQELADKRNKVLQLAEVNNNDEAYSLYLGEVEESRAALNDTLKEMQQSTITNAESINGANNKNKQEIIVFVTGIIVIALIILVALSTIISRMIVRPINEIKGLVKEAENGDFTVKGNYESKDEIGQLTASINNMTNSLQTVFSTVQDSTQQVASASEQLSASAEQNSNASEHITMTVQELALGSDKQLEAVEQSSRVIGDITNHTETISGHTEKITKDVLHTSTLSIEGNKAIQKVNEQMNSIFENVNSLSMAVKSLDSRSNEIGQITNVITGISAQTNLLALNAAIEAARAGEHGKGFAVVADEVRKLAEESTNSTEQIANLIQLIQHDTSLTLETMEKAAKEVQSGLNVVSIAGSSFEKIEQAVNGIVSQIEDISQLLKNLSSGTVLVNDSIKNVSNVAQNSSMITQNISAATEEQLASMQEITSSSLALAKLADNLQVLIKQFKI